MGRIELQLIEHGEEQEPIVLHQSSVVGRGRICRPRSDDPAISEAHALVSQRSEGWVLFALRGRLRHLADPPQTVDRVHLAPGVRVELSPDIELVVHKTQLDPVQWALHGPEDGPRRITGELSLVAGRIVHGRQAGAERWFWLTGTELYTQTPGSRPQRIDGDQALGSVRIRRQRGVPITRVDRTITVSDGQAGAYVVELQREGGVARLEQMQGHLLGWLALQHTRHDKKQIPKTVVRDSIYGTRGLEKTRTNKLDRLAQRTRESLEEAGWPQLLPEIRGKLGVELQRGECIIDHSGTTTLSAGG